MEPRAPSSSFASMARGRSKTSTEPWPPSLGREESEERGFVDGRHAELLRLVELRPGARPDDQVVGLFRETRGHLPALRFDPFGRFFTRERIERTGDHERL